MAVVDEQMDARDVCVILAEKNHQNFGPNWTLVERLEDLELGKRNCNFIIVHIYVVLWIHVSGVFLPMAQGSAVKPRSLHLGFYYWWNKVSE